MGKHLSYNFHIWKNAYHRVFIQFSVLMELYEFVWQEVSHIWKLYDKKFWSTREYCAIHNHNSFFHLSIHKNLIINKVFFTYTNEPNEPVLRSVCPANALKSDSVKVNWLGLNPTWLTSISSNNKLAIQFVLIWIFRGHNTCQEKEKKQALKKQA